MNEHHSKLLLFLRAAENNDPTMRFGSILSMKISIVLHQYSKLLQTNCENC